MRLGGWMGFRVDGKRGVVEGEEVGWESGKKVW